ncbi:MULTISPECIES: hypothetical protein [Trichocoleus]|uniref:ABC transporter permease n=1 Tax=Trichocoleus desertorum GB2-A4 TaxID=2933944 RepID=A0ABV0J4F9_9CYAN|nr:hypothetical protein [Trichocoleus sp. FACHB-46]MBD1862005.1 hypothetical protein [Trichocoleus sp. FACHB-46]
MKGGQGLMTAQWLDRVGDWNPQLFRELKGRLTRQSAFLVTLAALLLQFLLGSLVFESGSDPVPVFRILNWLLPMMLFVLGTVLLMTDLEQEERRGTLNFIRLSPQTSQSILLGKLLGVPVLVYLGAALLVPMHIWSTLAANVSLSFLVSFYGLLGVACAFIFSLALLSAFVGRFSAGQTNSLGSTSALVTALLVGLAFLPIYMNWNQLTVWSVWLSGLDTGGVNDLQWFFLPIGGSPAIAHSFTLLNAGLGIYWIWHILNRCFRSPTSALLSKRYSYLMTAHVELLLLGFLVQSSVSLNATSDWFSVLLCFSLVNLIWFGVLMLLLSPQRQALLDWARYRHAMTDMASGARQRSLISDLIGGDKSPVLVAMLLNFGLVAAILGTWVFLASGEAQKLRLLAGLLLSFTLLAIYVAIAQFATLAKSRQHTLQVAVAIGGVALLPPLLLVLAAQGEPTHAKELMLFSPLLWLVLDDVSATAIALSLLGQLGLLGLLTFRFTQKLTELGASETKALLPGRDTAFRARPRGAD